MSSVGFSGARLVARGGSAVEERYDGLADAATGVHWTPRTPSQIASISKQYAAVVALALVERGVIALDDPVAPLLDGCPEQWRQVSVRHLLTHTSGMTHWSEAPGFDPALPLDAGARLGLLLAAPLAQPPGEGWHYSSPGYVVLGAALEAAGGRPYAELVREHVVDRLALRRTTVGRAAAADVAHGHRDGRPVPLVPLHMMPGTGDVWSTAGDVARFLRALHTGDLLGPATRALLHDRGVSLGDAAEQGARITTDGYGLGHFRGTVDGEPALLHPGDNPGYQSFAAWLPATDTLVVALSNDETDDIGAAVADLASGRATDSEKRDPVR